MNKQINECIKFVAHLLQMMGHDTLVLYLGLLHYIHLDNYTVTNSTHAYNYFCVINASTEHLVTWPQYFRILILEIIPSQKCHINMCLILNGCTDHVNDTTDVLLSWQGTPRFSWHVIQFPNKLIPYMMNWL
jgi:hypothetical protein